jgi:hypothetical protein
LRGGLLLFLAGNGHGLGACQGAKERFEERSSPYRHQPVSRHLELRGAPLDGGSLVRGLYVAEPDGSRRSCRCPRLIGFGGGSGFLAMPAVSCASYARSIALTEPRPLPKLPGSRQSVCHVEHGLDDGCGFPKLRLWTG